MPFIAMIYLQTCVHHTILWVRCTMLYSTLVLLLGYTYTSRMHAEYVTGEVPRVCYALGYGGNPILPLSLSFSLTHSLPPLHSRTGTATVREYRQRCLAQHVASNPSQEKWDKSKKINERMGNTRKEVPSTNLQSRRYPANRRK